jgi:hypothetical protein
VETDQPSPLSNFKYKQLKFPYLKGHGLAFADVQNVSLRLTFSVEWTESKALARRGAARRGGAREGGAPGVIAVGDDGAEEELCAAEEEEVLGDEEHGCPPGAEGGLKIIPKLFMSQEARNRPNIDWQEKIHRGILRGLRNISETP